MRTTDKWDGSEIVQNDKHKLNIHLCNVSLHTALTLLCSLLVASFIRPLQQWFPGTLRTKVVGNKHLIFCFLRNLPKNWTVFLKPCFCLSCLKCLSSLQRVRENQDNSPILYYSLYSSFSSQERLQLFQFLWCHVDFFNLLINIF